MKHLVVQFLEKGAIALLVIVLVAGFVGGYNAHGLGTALLGIIVAFVLSVSFFGFLFVCWK